MKKILFLILITVITSCGAKKTKISEQQKIDILIDSLNYNIVLPENWHPILDSHKLLSYSPKNLGDIFYKNIIRIYNISTTENENNTLQKIVEKNINGLIKAVKIDSLNVTTGQSKFGEIYIAKYKTSWNFTNYMILTKYFKFKDNYYFFQYESDKRFYEKYLNDSEQIFNSITFNN